jgi:transcription elongation factor Elf1
MRQSQSQHRIDISQNSQREGLDTKFKCVFCNSEDSISTKIDKKAGVASLSCKNCVQSYQMSANCMTAIISTPFVSRVWLI